MTEAERAALRLCIEALLRLGKGQGVGVLTMCGLWEAADALAAEQREAQNSEASGQAPPQRAVGKRAFDKIAAGMEEAIEIARAHALGQGLAEASAGPPAGVPPGYSRLATIQTQWPSHWPPQDGLTDPEAAAGLIEDIEIVRAKQWGYQPIGRGVPPASVPHQPSSVQPAAPGSRCEPVQPAGGGEGAAPVRPPPSASGGHERYVEALRAILEVAGSRRRGEGRAALAEITREIANLAREALQPPEQPSRGAFW